MKSIPALLATLLFAGTSDAAVLFTHAGPETLANDSLENPGGFSLSRTDTDNDTLYFKFTVTNPASNLDTENYFAGVQLWDAGSERIGVGNAWGPFAYSAFGAADGDVDLNSASPEPGATFQLVRPIDITTFVYRVDFVAGADDNVTVWLDPDLGIGEAGQDSALVTNFTANATFDALQLRHGGGGDGWTFSDLAVAENSTDPGFFAVPEPSTAVIFSLGLAVALRRRRAC